MEEEEESSCPCIECEVPRELLLHTDQLMPPLEIGFEKFEDNILMVQQFPIRGVGLDLRSTVDTRTEGSFLLLQGL